jgi:hypothetical protein
MTVHRSPWRKASNAEIAYWIAQYHKGATNEDIVTGFLASAEYYAGATT